MVEGPTQRDIRRSRIYTSCKQYDVDTSCKQYDVDPESGEFHSDEEGGVIELGRGILVRWNEIEYLEFIHA
jgi:hypothetical protein